MIKASRLLYEAKYPDLTRIHGALEPGLVMRGGLLGTMAF